MQQAFVNRVAPSSLLLGGTTCVQLLILNLYIDTIDIWTKGCIIPFPKKGVLGIAKNYRGITLTSIAVKI